MRDTKAFTDYYTTQFKPAYDWAHNEDGKAWIKAHARRFYDDLYKLENEITASVYALFIQIGSGPELCLYVGESWRPVKRAYIHFFHMEQEPIKYFSLSSSEVKKAKLRVEILTPPILSESMRKNAESIMCKELSPILQPYSSLGGNIPADMCLPRRCRRKAIEESGLLSGS